MIKQYRILFIQFKSKPSYLIKEELPTLVSGGSECVVTFRNTLTQRLTSSMAAPLAGLTALQLSLTSGSESQSFES